MEAEGRILTRDWRQYNSRDDVVYQPKQMNVAELVAGFGMRMSAFIRFPVSPNGCHGHRFNYVDVAAQPGLWISMAKDGKGRHPTSRCSGHASLALRRSFRVPLNSDR